MEPNPPAKFVHPAQRATTRGAATKVVYVLGVGRSGSTILDIYLGNSLGALSAGELTWFPFVVNHDSVASGSRSLQFCSCGAGYPDCPVWGEVARSLDSGSVLASFRASTRLFERRGSFPLWVLTRLVPSNRLREHIRIMEAVVLRAAAQTNSTTIIDSSKVVTRGLLYLLMRDRNIQTRFVHIVRDGTSHLESRMLHRDPGSDEPGPPLRAGPIMELLWTLDWLTQNLIASLAGFCLKDRFVRVRYEDLTRDPSLVIGNLGRALDLDVRATLESLRDHRGLKTGHAIAGNRLKFSLTLEVQAEPPQNNHRARGTFRLFRLLAGWLQWAYGYSPSGGVRNSEDRV